MVVFGVGGVLIVLVDVVCNCVCVFIVDCDYGLVVVVVGWFVYILI